jgi:hypothetical protein
MATGSPSIHGYHEITGTVLSSDSVSAHVSRFVGVSSLGDIRSLGHSVALGAKAARGLASDHNNSAFPGSQARFLLEGHHT